MSFITTNLWEIISVCMIVFELIVRLTPTEKDNTIYNKIKGILDSIIPNRKVGGGNL